MAEKTPPTPDTKLPNICSQCGAPLSGLSCSYCGTSFRQDTPAQSATEPLAVRGVDESPPVEELQPFSGISTEPRENLSVRELQIALDKASYEYSHFKSVGWAGLAGVAVSAFILSSPQVEISDPAGIVLTIGGLTSLWLGGGGLLETSISRERIRNLRQQLRNIQGTTEERSTS